MTSFITTMFVHSPSPSQPSFHHSPFPSFPSDPKPLPPVFTLPPSAPVPCIRADPRDCVFGGPDSGVPVRRDAGCWDDAYWHRAHLGYTPPTLPGGVYSSPLQKAFGEALRGNLHALLTPQPSAPPNPPLGPIPQPTVVPDMQSRIPMRAHENPSPRRGILKSSRPPKRPHTHVGNQFGNAEANTLFLASSNNRVGRTGNGGTAAFRAKEGKRGTSSWQLKQFAEATLGSGSLRKAVQLPEGEDLGEWLAVNVVDFYNQINLIYGAITEFCSPQSCPEMKATDEFEYLWQDSENYKKPTKMPAPEYIEHLMAWVQSNIDNESMFPSRIGVAFPKQFPALIRQLFKRLYRVYAHIYCHHYPVIIALGLEPHLNTSFKHYVLFVDEHQLNQGSRDYWGPLGDLVESMLKSD
ncbi:protein kinase regulator [Diplodia corticola]|uniref:Protein kinase regulator n=1 Tax=Diplodia corticola TaxID=236234 RepID=A0A1J9QZ84_9PEZI|nr:protein kinase regulator [Diplodia corticola]OJD33290.1 protein kinase regulator [Diplodia corticola]